MGLKSNKIELAVKVEATPGTLESIAEADLVVEPRVGITPSFPSEEAEPDEIAATSSPKPTSFTRHMGSISLPYRLRGPGDQTTVPAIDPLFKSAMLQRETVKTVAIGAVTGGPFRCGETVTGATSGATGRLIRRVSNGDSVLPLVELTGTFQSGEDIDGGTSSAQATSSGTPQNAGYVYRPNDQDVATTGHCVTARFNNDGVEHAMRGCLSDLNINFSPCRWADAVQVIQGPVSSPTDVALLNPASYPETSGAVPKTEAAGLVLGSYTLEKVTDFQFSYPTGVAPAIDANVAAGNQCIAHMDYDRIAQKPTLRVSPAMTPVATYDFFGQLRGEGTFYLEWQHGSTAGRTWHFLCPAGQIISAGWLDEAPRNTKVPIDIRLNGDLAGNDEFHIWVH